MRIWISLLLDGFYSISFVDGQLKYTFNYAISCFYHHYNQLPYKLLFTHFGVYSVNFLLQWPSRWIHLLLRSFSFLKWFQIATPKKNQCVKCLRNSTQKKTATNDKKRTNNRNRSWFFFSKILNHVKLMQKYNLAKTMTTSTTTTAFKVITIKFCRIKWHWVKQVVAWWLSTVYHHA